MSTTTGSTPWWHRAAVYQVYPRSFLDGNGDAQGDLVGVIDRLPYLASLGIDAIWLSPFYPSPQHDSGYDVADPRDVDPMYGSVDDARRLFDAAHARGLRVLVDVVPNHFSTEHPWFQAALAAPPGSPERARFHFRDGRGIDGELPPSNWMSMFGGGAWTRISEPDGSPGQWYLHTFDASQPDLNWTNAQVRADWERTLRFWLDLGADGFRVDVAFGLAKDMAYPDIDDPEGFIQALRLDLDTVSDEAKARRARVANSAMFDRDELQDVYREWRTVLDEYPGDRMAVCEAWLPPERAARYVAPDTLHQIFNFDFLLVPFDADVIRDVIDRTVAGLALVDAPPTWALSNHDTPRVASRLGGGAVGRQRALAMALIAHCLPGSVYVFQGEELALEDVDLPDDARQDPVWFRTRGAQKGRDGARVPLPWSGDAPPYGFSDRRDADLWLPQPEGWGAATVDVQLRSPWSPLQVYRDLLRLRRAHPGLAEGEPLQVEVPRPGVLVVRRGRRLSCVVNTGSGDIAWPGVPVLVSDPSVRVDTDAVVLPPSTGAWLQS